MPTNTLCLWGTMRQIIFIYDCDATAWSLNFNMSSVHFGRFNKLLQYFKLLKLLKLFCCSSCKHSFQKNLLPPATVQFVIDPDIFLWLICCRTVLKQWHETNARNKPTNKCARKKTFYFDVILHKIRHIHTIGNGYRSYMAILWEAHCCEQRYTKLLYVFVMRPYRVEWAQAVRVSDNCETNKPNERLNAWKSTKFLANPFRREAIVKPNNFTSHLCECVCVCADTVCLTWHDWIDFFLDIIQRPEEQADSRQNWKTRRRWRKTTQNAMTERK